MGKPVCLVLLVTLQSAACGRISTAHGLRKFRLEGAAKGAVYKPGQNEKSTNSSFRKYLFEPTPKRESTLTCGANALVTADSRRERCPDECPLHVENRFNEPVCDFHCVEASTQACKELDPKADVPDLELGFCRPCIVQGCKECLHDGSDRCASCKLGHRLTADGHCHDELFWIWYVVFGVLGLLAMVVIVWVVDIAYRPTINDATLNRALRLRSRAKLRQPKFLLEDRRGDPDEAEVNCGSRQLWPLDTNLCNEVVGGPGLLLSFRFQVFVIVWGFLLGIGWLLLGYIVDNDLFMMGRRRYDSPRQQCMVVQWGYETQHRLLWTKVLFCLGAYLLTFVGALIFGVLQRRTYQQLDMQHSTHKDFTIIVEGLIGFSGKECLEEELKAFLEAETKQKVEAVSVGWAWEEECRDQLMNIIELDLLDLAAARRKEARSQGTIDEDSSDTAPEEDTNPKESEVAQGGAMTAYRALLQNVEALFLSRPVQKALTRGRSKGISKRHSQQNRGTQTADEVHRYGGGASAAGDLSSPKGRSMARGVSSPPTIEEDVPEGEEDTLDIKAVLEGLKTNGKAFVVFHKESIRDEVVRQLQSKEVSFRGKSLTIEAAHCEPDSVKWENFTDPELAENSLVSRFAVGLKWVLSGLLVWTCVFYAPFCWVSMSHDYHHGQEPPAIETFTFSMVVVIGNVIMYTVCSEATDRMKFAFVKDHELAYMFFYISSCMFNVVLDLIVTFQIAYYHLKGLDTRTYYGQPLDEVPTVTALLATYGMQRELADNLLAYSFPGTFLIPFIFEPLAAIYAPYKLMVLLVRSHTEMGTTTAEAYLASIPFDLSRYADIHLNVILAALVLMFPGGYNLYMFFGLAVSHVWIFVYDHFRVLRFSPSFDIVSMSADWWSQWILCIPAGIILSTLVMKYNQMVGHDLTKYIFGHQYGDPNESNWGVGILCVVTFFSHIVVHTILLVKVVPLFGAKEGEIDEYEEYRYCAKRLPCSWITANPVGCLRSKYFYEHGTPLTYCMRGKEHLLQENTQLGQYFVDQKTQAEDYSVAFSMNTWKSESNIGTPSGKRGSTRQDG